MELPVAQRGYLRYMDPLFLTEFVDSSSAFYSLVTWYTHKIHTFISVSSLISTVGCEMDSWDFSRCQLANDARWVEWTKVSEWCHKLGAKYRRLVFYITLDGPAFNKWDDVLRCGIFELWCCNPKPFCGKVAISTQGKSHASCHRILNKLDKSTRWSVLVCKMHILPKSSAGLKLRLVMVLYKWFHHEHEVSGTPRIWWALTRIWCDGICEPVEQVSEPRYWCQREDFTSPKVKTPAACTKSDRISFLICLTVVHIILVEGLL